MDEKIKIQQDIISFLKSSENIIYIDDSQEEDIHLLILEHLIENATEQLVILFRTESEDSFSHIFNNNNIRFKIGTRYSAGHHKVYMDTLDIATWDSSPGRIDIAVVFGESMDKEKTESCIADLKSRKAGKIFIITGV